MKKKKFYSTPYLIRAKNNFSLGGREYPNLPVLIDEYNCVVEPVTDYIRYKAVYENSSETTLNEYAKTLRQYWEFVSIQELSWDAVNDSLMIAWRDWMYSRECSPLKKSTINGKLSTIYSFYWWCELKGYINGVIGQSGQQHLDCHECGAHNKKNITYSINVKVKISTSKKGETTTTISCPLAFRTTYDVDDRNPTSHEVDELYAALSSSKSHAVNVRNALIARWCEQVMVRRSEHLALKVSQIPTMNEIIKLIDEDRDGWITLHKTKGSKKRVVKVDSQLLSDTREYIDGKRYELIQKFKARKDSEYIEPEEIFLSHKTGLVLTENSVSNLFTAAAKKINLKNGTQHRLRSIGATELTTHTIDAEIEKHGRTDSSTVILRTQQLLGHSDPSTTMKHYVRAQQSRLNRELSINDQEFKVKQRLKFARRSLHQVKSETLLTEELEKLQKDILKGNKKDILAAIEKFAKTVIDEKESNHD